jgi:OPA family glycerol-3-phosphate transporter-like MFS transporter
MEESDKKIYNKWRLRILSLIILGYGAYYLCRQNFSMIMPVYIEEFGYSKTQLGAILSIASIVYGIGKFANGYFSDKSNARYFMSAGLLLSGIITVILGFSSGLWVLAALWVLNNWVQSMGWPPAARMLTHWFAPTELGRKWALGAASHQVGGGLTIILTGYLVADFGWRYAFFIPGILSIMVAFILLYWLRESPLSVGLPTVEIYKNVPASEDEAHDNLPAKEILYKVFVNKKLWLICCANMCVYIVRVGIIFWAPLFLKEFKNIPLTHAGWQVAAYEIFGLLGGFAAGWISDKIFKGARGPVGAVFLIFLALSLLLFWQMPEGFNNFSAMALILVGFFVYGPQVLIGVASADFASKKAIGTANGLAGTMGYVGSALSGGCVGWLIDNAGWDSVFIFFITAALIGSYLFFLTWERA